MLPHVLLDPSAVWAADEADSQEILAKSLIAILKWIRPRSAGPLQVMFSRRSLNALTEHGAFPAEDHLARVIDGIGLKGIVNSRAIATNLSRYLASTGFIEDYVGCDDAITTMSSLEPDISDSIISVELKELSQESAVFAALNCKIVGGVNVYAFPRLSETIGVTQVKATVAVIQGTAEAVAAEGELDQELKLVQDPDEWSSILEGTYVWKSAEDTNEVEVALWVRAHEVQQQNPGSIIKRFRVGTEFRNSLQTCQAFGNGNFSDVTLNKCVLMLISEASVNPAPFRVSTARNSSVRKRKRDNAVAWRVHVTGGHEALRLMYWELPDGSVELATVGPKSQLVIHDGTPLPPRQW